MAELRHAGIRRGGRAVLAPATLALPDAGTVGLIGVNGAGKSTLFSALTGVLDGRAGRATLDGVDARVGYAPQQPAFPEWLGLEQVARLYGLEYGVLMARYPELLLEEVAGRAAGALSVGQRQAVSVALALGIEAPLTLLDEPFAPLDFRRRIGLVRTLQARRLSGGITVISSQAAVDLLDTCDWIVVLRDGHYVFSGPTTHLAGDSSETAEARGQFEDAVVALLSASGPQARQPSGT